MSGEVTVRQPSCNLAVDGRRGAGHNEKNKTFHAVTGEETFVASAPTGPSGTCLAPPLGGFSKRRPMAVVGNSGAPLTLLPFRVSRIFKRA